VTAPAPGDGDSLTRQNLAALEMLGFTDDDRLRLRFLFEASDHRDAVGLATELRMITRNPVEVRLAPDGLQSPWPWAVVLTTAPTMLTAEVIASRESEMRALERRQVTCRYVGWTPVLDILELRRMVNGPG
jgi:hypothetical protein